MTRICPFMVFGRLGMVVFLELGRKNTQSKEEQSVTSNCTTRVVPVYSKVTARRGQWAVR